MVNNKSNWTMLLAASIFIAFILGFYIANQSANFSEITGFTVTVGGGNNVSKLVVFDQSDSEGGSIQPLFNTTIRFFANFTNVSTGQPLNDSLGSNCNITFQDSADNNMTFNYTSGMFEYNRTLLQAGLVNFSVNCTNPAAETWNVTDNLSVGCGYVNSNLVLSSNISINGSSCYYINASNLTLDCNGFAIIGNITPGTKGIDANFQAANSNITIQNCIIKRFQQGIASNASPAVIRNNRILDIAPSSGSTTYGITLYFSENNTVTNNTITNVSGGFSNDAVLNLQNVHFSNITYNTLANSTTVEAGLYLVINDTFNLVAHNFLSNTVKGIRLTGGTSGGGSNNTFLNNTIVNMASFGFDIQASSNGNTFTQNTLSNNGGAFNVFLSTDLSLLNNTIANSSSGIIIGSPANATIANNTFSNLTTIISFTGDPIIIDLMFQNQFGSVEYRNLSINGTVSTSIINISQNLIAVNVSANPLLNHSARVCVNFSGSCTPNIFAVQNFTTNYSFIIANGISCGSSSDPACTAISCSAPQLCFNVSHWSSYAVQEVATPPPTPPSPGPTTGTHSTAPAPLVKPKPQVQPPVLPKLDNIATSLQPNLISINSYPCVSVDGSEKSDAVTQVEIAQSALNLRSDENVIIQPFAANCKSRLDITLNLPDIYKDARAVKCTAEGCSEISGAPAERLECGTDFYPDISRKTVQLDPKDFPIRLASAEASNTNIIENNYRIVLPSIYGGKITASPLTTAINEPLNRFARIAGTPLEIRFSAGIPKGTTKITLPYSIQENVDENSIGIYVYKDGDWKYINGKIDPAKKTVSAEFTEDSISDDMIVAPIGVFCFNCLKSGLLQFYNGTSRDAVLLIHGLEIAPGRLQDIMNDIKLTNQPWQGWTFEYLSNRSINENAKDLADLLEANSDKYDYIYIAAHSMGGIIAQEAVRYAYEENQNRTVYTFPFKVRKIVTIASPNKGTLSEGAYKDLFEFLIRSQAANELFNFNSQVIRELVQGKTVQRVPNIDYLVIAGTRPYDFLKTDIPNDGIISVDSAQFIGGQPVNNRCQNFWDINITHTGILNNPDSRRIIERIVSTEIAQSIREKGVMGYNQYFRIKDDSCSPGAIYAVVGKKISPDQAAVPAKCGCGNGACGVDENEVSCPADCAKIEQPKTRLIDLIKAFLPVNTILFFMILLLSGAILVVYVLKKHKREHSDSQLSELKSKMNMHLDSGQRSEATKVYEQMIAVFSDAPESIREGHRDEIIQMHEKLTKLNQ